MSVFFSASVFPSICIDAYAPGYRTTLETLKMTDQFASVNNVPNICNSYIASKRGFVQIIPPSWGLSYQFDWNAINRSRR